MAPSRTAKATTPGAERDLQNIEQLPGRLDTENTGSARQLQVDSLERLPIAVAQWDKGRGEIARVTLDKFQGRATIDCRLWYSDDAGNLKPSRSGITLAVRHLPALADALSEALALGRELGLIEGGGAQ